MDQPPIIRISAAATKSGHETVALINRDLVERKASDAKRSDRRREIHVFSSEAGGAQRPQEVDSVRLGAAWNNQSRCRRAAGASEKLPQPSSVWSYRRQRRV